MVIVQMLTLLIIMLFQTLGYSQANTLDTFSEKYNSRLTEQNTGIGILVKKGSNTETTSLGNFNFKENSVFNIGSATKTFTAVLVLQEMERGNLKLTDSIGTHLTPIRNVDGSLTVESLLTHESGLDEVVGNLQEMFYEQNDSLYNDNLLDHIEKSNPKMLGKFDYSNTNYLLLGKILEKITDRSYSDLLRERIFIPLKMKNTYPYLHKNIPNLVAPFHEEMDVSEYLDYRFFANIAYAAGSIASTLSDMETFYISLFETELLLKQRTVKMMMEAGNEVYGYGLFKTTKNGQTYYGHGGNNIGYAFRNQYNPETKDLILMFANTRKIPMREYLTNDLLAYLNNEMIAPFKSVDLENFEIYAGTYLLKEANLTLKIAIEDNRMYLISEAQGVKSELLQKSETALYDTTVGVLLTQIDGDDSSLTFNQNGFITTISKVGSEN